MTKQLNLDLAAALEDAQQGRDDGEMLIVRAGSAYMKVTAFNAGKHAAALRKIRAPRQRGELRSYPKFTPGMSTAEYVAKFAKMNTQEAALKADRMPAYVLPFEDLNTAPCALYENGELDYEVIEEIEEIEAEDAQSVAAPEVQSAPAAAVDSLYNPGTPDPKNSAALPELDGFRPGDVVDVNGRTIGRSTIELVFNRKLAGFDAQPMARIVGASGKRLDVQLFQLTRVEAPAAPAEVQAPHVAASPEVSPPCGDIAPAAQDVAESKAAAPVEIEAADGAAAPAEPAPMTAEEPAKASASPEFAMLMAQARQARQMARDAVARAQASARDTRPPEPRTPKAPAASIRFMQHYVTNGTSKAKCRYYASATREGRAFVDVDAVSYDAQLRPIFGTAVRNDTDTMSDYFCKDSVRIFSDSPLYPAALARAKANDAKRQERLDKRAARFNEKYGC